MCELSNSARHSAGKKLIRLGSVLVGFVALVGTNAFGSLWESQTWALTSNVNAELGYDSNIFGRVDGDGDTFVAANPSLNLHRKSSATHLEFDLSARLRHFFDFDDQDSVDPRLQITYRFPQAEETLTAHRIDFRAERTDNVNLNAGRRATHTRVNGGWDGTLKDTGKTQVLASLGFNYLDYGDLETETSGLNAGLGVGWLRTELMQLSLFYQYSTGEVSSSIDTIPESDRTSHGLNIGIRGEISPKMDGRARFGIANNSYSGAYDQSDWNWYANADLTWRVHQRQSFSLSANRNNQFDALGNPYDNTSVDISMRQGITNLVSANFRLGWSQFNYVERDGATTENSNSRRDSGFQVGVSLNYNPSSRFNARLSYDWYSRDSGRNISSNVYTYDRSRVSIGASYRF